MKVRPHTANKGNNWDRTVEYVSRYSDLVIPRDGRPTFKNRSVMLSARELHWLRGLPDIMEAYGSEVPARLLRDNLPFVMTIGTGGWGVEKRLDRLKPWFDKALGVMTHTDEGGDIIRNRYPDLLIRTVPNGVDTSMFTPPAEREPGETLTVGTAGLFNITDRMNTKGQNIYLETADSMLEDMTFRSLSGRPHIEMPDFMRSLDVFVLVSDYEGCSNAVMEAMACGCAPVITRVGWHGEKCTLCTNALFVEKDSESLKEALERLDEDRDLLNTLRTNAVSFAGEHSWSRVAPKYDAFFEEVCAQL